MDYELTEHARESLRKRSVIRIEWLERALMQPQKVELDAIDIELEHRLVRIDEYGGRVLRVIVNKLNDPIRIVTLYFDRGMKNRL